ncbi:MAG: general secretion pathway protein GspK [Planctomycetes bacterium]|nr:general secretion pathway protein GspK [Planctomycetota bacterium]
MNCVNTQYKYMNPYSIGTRRDAQDMNKDFIKDERVAPMVWDGPFPSVGWLGFVPAFEWGRVDLTKNYRFQIHPWRNLTPRPHLCHVLNPSVNPLYTLLGLRVGLPSIGSHVAMGWGSYPYDSTGSGAVPIDPGNWRPLACVPGVRAKININTASSPVLQAAFPSGIAAKIVKYRPYRCAEDIMGFPAPSAAGMMKFGEIPDVASRGDLVRKTFMQSGPGGEASVLTAAYVNPEKVSNPGSLDADCRLQAAPGHRPQGVKVSGGSGVAWYVSERSGLSKPFFARYAFETFSADADLVLIQPDDNGRPYRVRNEDFDDSGAGLMLDDVACDITEQLEWYMRYCNIIDIKSNFFTVYSRGRVFSLSGLCADARVRAVIGRVDESNEQEKFLPLGGGVGVSWYLGVPFRGPNGRADGVSLKSLRLLDN